MAGDIVILPLAIASEEFRPRDFLTAPRKPDDGPEVVKEQFIKQALVEQDVRGRDDVMAGKKVFQLLVVEADFGAVQALRIAVLLQDVLFVGMVLYFGFLVICLHGNAIVLVADGFRLLDGDGGVVEAVQ